MKQFIRHSIAMAAIVALSACEETPKAIQGQPALTLPPPPKVKVEGLEQVMGHNANTLIALFGKPEQDQREVNGRRLQFAGGGCVLDAYLYPPQAGREAIVTYTEARLPDGRDTDRAVCVSALLRSRGR
jgi:hypothetical protein